MTTNPVGSLPPATPNENIKPKTLGAEDFLKLLIVQLQKQNPLDATKSSEMLGQLSQITNVQTMNGMQDAISEQRFDQSILLGQSLIGKTILMADPAGGEVEGVVEKVSVEVDSKNIRNKKVNVMISGKDYPIAGLEAVLKAANSQPQPNP